MEVELRLFSLQLINDQNEDPLADAHVKGTPRSGPWPSYGLRLIGQDGFFELSASATTHPGVKTSVARS